MIHVKILIGYGAEHVDYVAASWEAQIKNYNEHLRSVHGLPTEIVDITESEFLGAGPDNMNRRTVILNDDEFRI